MYPLTDPHSEEPIHLRSHILQRIGNEVNVVSAFARRENHVGAVAIYRAPGGRVRSRFRRAISPTVELPHGNVRNRSALRKAYAVDSHGIRSGCIRHDDAAEINEQGITAEVVTAGGAG